MKVIGVKVTEGEKSEFTFHEIVGVESKIH